MSRLKNARKNIARPASWEDVKMAYHKLVSRVLSGLPALGTRLGLSYMHGINFHKSSWDNDFQFLLNFILQVPKWASLCLIASQKKHLYQYRKPSFLGVGGRVPQKQEVSFPANQFRKGSIHSDCTDGLFDIRGFFHTEAIKAKKTCIWTCFREIWRDQGTRRFVKKFVNRSEKNKHLLTRTHETGSSK